MLYRCLKVLVRLAMLIFCRKIIITKPEWLKQKGPLLLACNHPNSFLDAVILDALFEQPIYALTRGDVFKKPLYISFLTALKMLPVYRVSEGAENLSENYKTFDECLAIFKNNGIVQIFSEGKCINEWHLRPLKKGTARLAIAAWNKNIPVNVLPIGVNYSSFKKFGKNIFINIGDIIVQKDIDMNSTEGARHQAFNKLLKEQLNQLVFEISSNDTPLKKNLLERKASVVEQITLMIPALTGYIIHAPLYVPIQSFTWKRTKNNDHYDSVLTAILLFAYPLYVCLVMLITFLVVKSWWVLLFLFLFPFTAWSYVRLKTQVEK
jgi:1-acyl-sn-glycerol-3-phosphate acyltransferase